MKSKYLLFPYWLALKLRNRAYDKGRKKVFSASVPTICVGNVAVGGTGKTPHTEMILRMLSDMPEFKGAQLAVLSRGYKRKGKKFQQVDADSKVTFAGDEPLQIKRKFPEVTVAVDADRVEGCRFLADPELLKTEKRARKCKNKELPKADLIILDDAFQYRRLKADFNIVLVDYNRPLNRDELLPLGRLRDLPRRVDDADVIIVTKCPAELTAWERLTWTETLGMRAYSTSECEGTNASGRRQKVLFTTVDYLPATSVFPDGDVRYAYAKKMILFSGIANDTPIVRYLSDSFKVVRHFIFSDHHKYSRADLAKINSVARSFPTAGVITTEKDAQRVLSCKKVPESLKKKLLQLPIEVRFLTKEEASIFRRTLLDVICSE